MSHRGGDYYDARREREYEAERYSQRSGYASASPSPETRSAALPPISGHASSPSSSSRLPQYSSYDRGVPARRPWEERSDIGTMSSPTRERRYASAQQSPYDSPAARSTQHDDYAQRYAQPSRQTYRNDEDEEASYSRYRPGSTHYTQYSEHHDYDDEPRHDARQSSYAARSAYSPRDDVGSSTRPGNGVTPSRSSQWTSPMEKARFAVQPSYRSEHRMTSSTSREGVRADAAHSPRADFDAAGEGSSRRSASAYDGSPPAPSPAKPMMSISSLLDGGPSADAASSPRNARQSRQVSNGRGAAAYDSDEGSAEPSQKEAPSSSAQDLDMSVDREAGNDTAQTAAIADLLDSGSEQKPKKKKVGRPRGQKNAQAQNVDANGSTGTAEGSQPRQKRKYVKKVKKEIKTDADADLLSTIEDADIGIEKAQPTANGTEADVEVAAATNGDAAAATNGTATNGTESKESDAAPRVPGKRGGRILRAREPTAPKPKKRPYEAWDSDLDTEENRSVWAPALKAYAVEYADRLHCIEDAYEAELMQKEVAIGKRLSRGYRTRYEPVMERVQKREDMDRRRRELRQLQRQGGKHQDRDIEQELLGTLDDSSRARHKAKRAKQQAAGIDDDELLHELLGSSDEGGIWSDDDDMSVSRLKRRRIRDMGSYQAAEELESMMDDSRASSPGMAMTPLIEEEATLDPEVLAERREKALEEAHRRIWVNIARRDVPKVYRLVHAGATSKATYWRRTSYVAAREARRGAHSARSASQQQQKAKRVMREMLVFWKRNEKEERELRKKAEKEAVEKAKKEEEMREAKRQARKLNFLITQTELYSHFVGNKLKTSEAEESEETSGGNAAIQPAPSADAPPTVPPIGGADAEVTAAEARLAELKDIDFDEDDEANLRAHARRNAEEAVAAAKAKATAFDEQRRKQQAEAAAAEAAAGGRRIEEKDLGKAFDQDDMNFLNPTSMGEMQVKQPKMLTCQLKEYQLKGLNWLANLYEQGINGILADEMGLGKTVQSIALMAYLAEVHDIWGPFLVIAPASTLHNWQQELTKFVPGLKALPYWGNVKDRTVLRKFWNRKQISYHKDAPFHVLITSYQLVVADEKYFQRVKWQYMVLDEAQAIKSSSSMRWKSLLSFDCRNRLLLTGTPVQNSMQELWALLHFIMPSLFDSHDEFSEWFSKDIESHAENKGTLNEHQLRRLHMILKPFMLRRIKKNVQNELGDKIEIDVYCDMSARQRVLYRALRDRVSIAELMDKASSNDEAGLRSLMNLVMQFRKVCNHPELFERADVAAPLAFARFAQSGNLAREGDVLSCYESTTSLIEYQLPKFIARHGGLLNVPGEKMRSGFDTQYLGSLMNIWRAENIHTSLKADESKPASKSAFAFIPMLDVGVQDVENAMHGKASTQIMDMLRREVRHEELKPYLYDDDFAASSMRAMCDIGPKPLPQAAESTDAPLVPFGRVNEAYRGTSILAKRSARQLVSRVVAPPIRLSCRDGPITDEQNAMSRDDLVSKMLYGLAPSERESEPALMRAQKRLPGLPPNGLLEQTSDDQLPTSDMQVPQMNKLIVDSSKLSKLDELLRELKAGGHRVLVYFQMTRMIDLMEEYLVYRQYKYLRLDGSSKISERRDMVTDWQTKPEIFIFLLSTRAGGLGINLTAADTVIFYDHDWNPSNDSQAMDRAHRLGQTKQVTVYRLITKNTIDERIVKLARNKKEVQDIVVGNKAYTETGMAKPQEIVSLLLDDDQLAESMLRRKAEDERKELERNQANLRSSLAKRRAKQEAAANAAAVSATPTLTAAWTMEDDEDDFFGAKVGSSRIDGDGTPDVGTPRGQSAAPANTKKGKAKAAKTGTSKSKKPVDASGTSTPKRSRGRPSKTAAAATADVSIASSVAGEAREGLDEDIAMGEE